MVGGGTAEIDPYSMHGTVKNVFALAVCVEVTLSPARRKQNHNIIMYFLHTRLNILLQAGLIMNSSIINRG